MASRKGTGFCMPKNSGDIMKKAKHDETRVRAYQKILYDVHLAFPDVQRVVFDSLQQRTVQAIYCRSRELRYTPDFLSRLVTSSNPTQPVSV
jgi:hypothetical protein